MTGFVVAGGGFLLAVLWFDLMFDVQALRQGRGPLPSHALESITTYYGRVTTGARPMSHLVGLTMVGTIAAVITQLVQDDVPDGVAWVSLALVVAPVTLGMSRILPNAMRLGRREGSVEQQSHLARAVARDHVACFVAIVALLTLQLGSAR